MTWADAEDFKDENGNFLDPLHPPTGVMPWRAGARYFVYNYNHHRESDRARHDWKRTHAMVYEALEAKYLADLAAEVEFQFNLNTHFANLTPHRVRKALGHIPGHGWSDRGGKPYNP